MGPSDRNVTTLSNKGQVILPKAIRDDRGWTAGTRLTVETTEEGVLLRARPLFLPTRLEDVFGCLPPASPARSIEDMDAAIAEDIRRRHAGD